MYTCRETLGVLLGQVIQGKSFVLSRNAWRHNDEIDSFLGD